MTGMERGKGEKYMESEGDWTTSRGVTWSVGSGLPGDVCPSGEAAHSCGWDPERYARVLGIGEPRPNSVQRSGEEGP